MSNSPGHLKREKDTMVKTMGETAKGIFQTVRTVAGTIVKGIGAFTEMGGSVLKMPFEGTDTVLSWTCNKSVLRKAMESGSNLAGYVEKFGRGIHTLGEWISGDKSTSNFLKDICGLFKKAKYTATLTFPEIIVDGAQIGTSDKGAVLNLKFDKPGSMGKKELTGTDASAILTFDQWKPIECSSSMSLKKGSFINYTNEIVLKYKPQPDDPNKYEPNARFSVTFNRKNVCFEKPGIISNASWFKKTSMFLGPQAIYYYYRNKDSHNLSQNIAALNKIDPDDCLLIIKSMTLTKCHNKGEDFGMVFPNVTISDVAVYSLPRKEDFNERKDRDGSFVTFSLDF